ncbi:hypothetical protein [Microbispora sp. NPDC049125]|uniref:hypothetical protein n=1 Tax=Microbispora sp. NPDC049125 TaxID=3154929 RepID=UPI003465AE7B
MLVDTLNKTVPEGLSELANLRELAAMFTMFSSFKETGPENITARRVERWARDRDKTGFPAAEPQRRPTPGAPPQRLWNVQAALEWFLSWTPAKGGAPLGNQNGLLHGRYVGERARRAEQAARRKAS